MSALPLAVRVPSSTSNLGPGFDFLGLALPLTLEVELVRRSSDGRTSRMESGGAAREWPLEEDLLARALRLGQSRMGLEPAGYALRVRSQVPLERGLGSSGAAIIAGLTLARALSGREVSDSQLLRWALELEDHPDNITPALLGGCTLSMPAGAELVTIRQPVHSSLHVAVAWHDERIPTRCARAALPASVPFTDAMENPRRLGCLLEGLRTGDPRLLRLGGEDRLHVRHRLPLIPGGERALAAAEEAGAFLATLSGSGSALIALCDADRVAVVAKALRDELARVRPAAEAHVMKPEARGATVIRGSLEELAQLDPARAGSG